MTKSGPKESTIDDKNRVSIPLRFRDSYPGKLMITSGFERCVWIMSLAVYKRLSQSIVDSELLTPEERLELERRFKDMAEETEIDKIGRIAVPAVLKRYAGLSKDCMVLYSENRLELWNTESFFANLDKNDETFRQGYNKLGSNDFFRAAGEGQKNQG